MELKPRRLEKTIEALQKLKKKKEKQWDKKRGGQGERERKSEMLFLYKAV